MHRVAGLASLAILPHRAKDITLIYMHSYPATLFAWLSYRTTLQRHLTAGCSLGIMRWRGEWLRILLSELETAMAELYELTAHEAHDLLVKKDVSARQLLDAVYARIDAVEADLHSYVLQMRESAVTEAERVDAKLAGGEEIGPLEGIPLALKDILCTNGVRTTCCSKILENFIPPYDATVVTQLRNAGVVTVGKTNMDEFAMGPPRRIPPSGPAITRRTSPACRAAPAAGRRGRAAGEALALGTDTGGSIRQPAAFAAWWG